MPSIGHWGADLGRLTDADVLDLLGAGVSPVTANVVDEPVRLAVLPEHWTGWVGRPGLRGSRRRPRTGRPSSPSTEVRLDGTADPRRRGEPAVVVHADGPAVVEIDAVDDDRPARADPHRGTHAPAAWFGSGRR